jgi:TolB-like protein/Flp pilus assembly protein TadD/predicted Ser/Thr protein kinase
MDVDPVGGGLAPGTRLDQYRIERLLGRGGMGAVYLAHDTTLRRLVALKVVDAAAGAADARQSLLREARSAAALNHPHVCTIHEVRDAGGTVFITMEYVEGPSIKDVLAAGALPIADALRYGVQAAAALAHAHAHGVIHRDLKAANVIVTGDGQAKVVDFGLARRGDALLGGATTEVSLAPAGATVGTPYAMAPEQVRGETADARSDIWAIGVLLYEMLAGRAPFAGATLPELFSSVLTAAPPPLPASVPAGVRAVVTQCLEKDPARRYQEAGQVHAALAALAAGAAPAPDERADRPRSLVSAGPWGWAAVVVAIALVGAAAWRLWPAAPEPSGAGGSAHESRVLVVLPFQNLGRSQDDYFADGISDEITARLARVGGLGIIARASAMQYKGVAASVRQIRDELGVDYILDGTVRWEQRADGVSYVRVTPKLVRTADGIQVWADAFEEPLAGVFQVQADIAEKVADAMDLALLEPERRALRATTTDDPEAFDFYLRCSEHFRRSNLLQDMEIALDLCRRAVARAPGYATAHAQASRLHSSFYWFYYDRSPERLARALEAAEHALALAPGLPEGHIALAYYHYHGHLDYERALRELEIARAGAPSHPEIVGSVGWILRRQGRWREALDRLTDAARFDPRSPSLNSFLGETHWLVRDYREASRHVDRARDLNPGWLHPRLMQAEIALAEDGTTARARAALEDGLRFPELAADPIVQRLLFTLDLYDRDFEAALRRVEAIPQTEIGEQFRWHPTALHRAHAHEGLGQVEAAREQFTRARAYAEEALGRQPDDARMLGARGLALSGLKQHTEAIATARQGLDLMPVERDAFRGMYRVEELARVLASAGKADEAVALLERLLSQPSHLSPALLRLDPAWDPLREHAGFRRLLQ